MTAIPYCCKSLSENSSKLVARCNTDEICLRKVSFTVSNFFCREKSTGLDLRVFEDAITFKIALMVVKYMKYMESLDY